MRHGRELSHFFSVAVVLQCPSMIVAQGRRIIFPVTNPLGPEEAKSNRLVTSNASCEWIHTCGKICLDEMSPSVRDGCSHCQEWCCTFSKRRRERSCCWLDLLVRLSNAEPKPLLDPVLLQPTTVLCSLACTVPDLVHSVFCFSNKRNRSPSSQVCVFLRCENRLNRKYSENAV